MKKWYLLVLTLVLLLTGCAQVQIACGVDQDFNAYLTGKLEGQWPEAEETLAGDLKTGFQALAAHYRDTLGFQVTETYTDTGCTLELALIRPCDNGQEAVEELEKILTDPALTPFQEVVLFATQEGQTQGCLGTLVLDAQPFLDNLGLDDLPVNLQQYFKEHMEGCAATLELSLPAGQVLSHKGTLRVEGMQAWVSAPVNLEGKTEVSLSTMTVLQDGVPVQDPTGVPLAQLEQAHQELTRMGALLGGGVLALLVTLTVLLVKALARRKARRAAALTTVMKEVSVREESSGDAGQEPETEETPELRQEQEAVE